MIDQCKETISDSGKGNTEYKETREIFGGTVCERRIYLLVVQTIDIYRSIAVVLTGRITREEVCQRIAPIGTPVDSGIANQCRGRL